MYNRWVQWDRCQPWKHAFSIVTGLSHSGLSFPNRTASTWSCQTAVRVPQFWTSDMDARDSCWASITFGSLSSVAEMAWAWNTLVHCFNARCNGAISVLSVLFYHYPAGQQPNHHRLQTLMHTHTACTNNANSFHPEFGLKGPYKHSRIFFYCSLY